MPSPIGWLTLMLDRAMLAAANTGAVVMPSTTLEISSKHFTWNAATRTFSGEASELEHLMLEQGRDRLDYQSGRWGFHMLSERTGRTVWFRRVMEHRDAEGDITHVEFHAWCEPSREWLKLVVFND
jgi:hypothetical protein